MRGADLESRSREGERERGREGERERGREGERERGREGERERGREGERERGREGERERQIPGGNSVIRGIIFSLIFKVISYYCVTHPYCALFQACWLARAH